MEITSFSSGYTIKTTDLPIMAVEPFMTAIIADNGKCIFRKRYKSAGEAERGHGEIVEDFKKNKGNYLSHFWQD